MPKLSVQVGSTSQTVDIFIQDATATDGSGKSGLVYNTSGLTAYYNFPRGASTAITLATLSSATAAWSSGGFKEIDTTNEKGHYRFDIPNACLASGNGRSCKIVFQGTGIVPCPLEIELTGWDNQDAAAGGITDISALATNYTSTRAGYLDILNNGTYGNNALLTAINNINNLSALANLYGPTSFIKPASSTIAYPLTLTVKDEEGHLIDLDSSPTVTVANGAGTDRSANLSSVTHPSTGVYSFTYTVSSTDADEGLMFTASGTVSSSSRKAFFASTVSDVEALSTLTAIKSQTDKLIFDSSNNVKATLAGVTMAFTSGFATNQNDALNQIYNLYFGKSVKDRVGLTIKTYDPSSLTTVLTTQTYTDDGIGGQQRNKAS